MPRGADAAPSPVAGFRASGLAVAAGALLALVLTLGKALTVWRTGMFFDPDDAMRAVEVRDFLAGQGWFDLVPHRLSPDHPFLLHWSRLVDVPLALAMGLLRRVTDADTAERLTRLTEPAALYVLFLTLLASLARALVGRGGPLAAALLAAGGLDLVGNFVPGHIHHHALQVTLLVAIVKLLIDALDPEKAGRAGWAGALAALSLAVNLQNLPFVAAGAGLLVFFWVDPRNRLGRALGFHALGLVAGATVVFLLQVPPSRFLAPVCDAFGAPHLLAAWVGGAGLLGLAGVSPRSAAWPARALAAAVLGAGTLLAVKLAYPACLGDPYAAVDPLLRERWLSEVGEAMPLRALLARDPAGTLPLVATLVAGLATTAAAAWSARGLDRRRWMVVAALSALAVLGSCWEVRVAASAEAFAALGGAWLLCRWFGPGRPGLPARPAVLGVVCGLALTQAGWAAVVPARLLSRPSPAAQGRAWPPLDAEACFAPASYATLAAFPPGRVLSGIDLGSHILAHTPHDAFAAPYHRDAAGNRLALLAFVAAPAAAERMIREARADALALCLASPEIQDFALQNPDGLAGQIMAGRTPDWLAPVLPDAGPMRVFRVVPAGG